VTGTAASAAAIAALGLFATGQPAYAGDTGIPRTGPAAGPVVDGIPQDRGDEGGGTSGRDAAPGVNIPSLLDSVGGLNALPGLGTAPRREGSNDRGNRNSSEDEGSSRRDETSKRDGSSSDRDHASGRDGSSVPDGPRGHVKTGVGGSVRSDTTQIAAGAGVLAGTAVGGAWLLRRRASGTQKAG